MTIEEKLAQTIVDTKYEGLPREAIEYAKKSVLDTIGAAIAGSDEPGCRQLIDLIKKWGGRKEATIWVYGGHVPAPLAALAIGPMAGAKELGDFHRRSGGVHATEHVVPAVLPMAEYVGHVNGRDFITAIALGQDIMCRLGIAVGRSVTITGRLGLTNILGPTAACARILGLGKEETHNALGIAYSGGLSSIDMQQYIDGSMTVYMHYGFCVEGAVKSALLAQRGIRGTRNFLQGRWGYFDRVEPQHLDLELVTQDLGKTFEGAYLSTKPYPSCGCTHVSISAVTELVMEHDIKPQDIEEIDIGMVDTDYQMTFLPSEERYCPPNQVSARMSVPYTAATAATKRSLSLEDFTPEALTRRDVRELMVKVKGRVEPALNKYHKDAGPGGPVIARIKTKDGREYVKQVNICKGHHEKPMTFEEVAEEKFMKYLPFAAKPVSRERAEELIELVGNLEKLEDVTRIAKLLGTD